jgi:hypothetical protein
MSRSQSWSGGVGTWGVKDVFAVVVFKLQADFELQGALLVWIDDVHPVQIELRDQIHKLLVRVVPKDYAVVLGVEDVVEAFGDLGGVHGL